MDIKYAYTKTFMIGAGEEDKSDDSIKKNYMLWWQNTREKGAKGMRLTRAGFEYATDKAELKTYEIDCPYFVTKKRIFVFSEKMALQLMMFAGDIKQYGLARAMAKEISAE